MVDRGSKSGFLLSLSVGVLIIALASLPSESQSAAVVKAHSTTSEANMSESTQGFLHLSEYLYLALAPDGSARLNYSAVCEPPLYLPVPPRSIRIIPPPNSRGGLAAVKAVFSKEPTARVAAGPGGLIRIALGTPPHSILRVKLPHVALRGAQRTSARSAIGALLQLPELQARMREEGYEPLPYLDSRLSARRKLGGVLPSSIDGATLDQALDLIALTFRDVITYGACSLPDGKVLFVIQTE